MGARGFPADLNSHLTDSRLPSRAHMSDTDSRCYFYLFTCILFYWKHSPTKRHVETNTKQDTGDCRDNVPMYREQLDRPGVSALALQPGIEKTGGCMVKEQK